MGYIGIGFLIIADVVVAIPKEKRLLRYLYAFYRNIPAKIKEKYDIKFVIDFIKKDFLSSYLEHNSNIRKTRDLVSLNILLEYVTTYKNKEEAFRFLIKCSKKKYKF